MPKIKNVLREWEKRSQRRKGSLDPSLIIATALTAVMDGLGHSIRSEYKKGK